MRDGEETVLYEVVLSGDQWDHERFRETVGDIEGAGIETERGLDDVASPGDRWAELTVQTDGIGLSLYEKRPGEPVEVVDETWFTNDEIAEMRASNDGPGKVILDAKE